MSAYRFAAEESIRTTSFQESGSSLLHPGAELADVVIASSTSRAGARRATEGEQILTKGEATYSTSLLAPKKLQREKKPRAATEALKDVVKGLRRRGESTTSALLHPRSSIAVPMVQASEYSGEASVWSCVMSLTNSVIGAGILGLPYCMAVMGLIPGTIWILFSSFLSAVACFFVMVAAKTIKGGTTFSDMGWKTFPRMMKYVDFMNFLSNFGALAAYLIIVGDMAPVAFRHVVRAVGGNEHSQLLGRTLMICLFSAVFVLPTIGTSVFNHLRYVSMFAICCFGYIVFVAILYATVPSLRNELHETVDTGDGVYNWPRGSAVESALRFVSVVPIIVLAFGVTQNAVAVTSELKNNSTRRIGCVVALTFLLCGGIYIAVGVCGFVSFGVATKSDVLVNYPSSWLVTVLRIGLAIAISNTYPMWMHPCRENVAFMLMGRSAVHPLTSKWQYYGITYGIWAASFGVAMATDNLGLVLALAGAIGSVVSLFVVPGLMFYYRCTPHGGPEFYSPFGHVEDNEEDSFAGVEEEDDSSFMDMSDIGIANLLGKGKLAWNVWPFWWSFVALAYVVVGAVLVPVCIVVQFLPQSQ